MPRPEREGIMLAYPVDEGRVSRLGEKFFIQRKYRGERCRVEWFHGEPVLVSSYGNEFQYLDRIKSALLLQSNDTFLPFDGELYKHGWSQERINSAANRKVNRNPDTDQLEFHIFDIQFSWAEQWKRIHALNFYQAQGMLTYPLTKARTKITDSESWLHYATEFVDEGYEGAILRKLDAPYYFKRNVCLLKFKPTETDEYKILQILEAISEEGEPKGMVGSFRVETSEGITFRVGAGKLKHNKRIEYWNNRERILGKLLITKHEVELTEKGKPICATAVEVK